MNPDLLQWLLIGFIILSILYISWRGGSANPRTTGQLSNDIGKLDRDVSSARTDAQHANGRIDPLEARLSLIEREAVRRADIAHIEATIEDNEAQMHRLVETISQMRADIAEHKATGEHTSKQVDRLYDFIVRKGIET